MKTLLLVPFSVFFFYSCNKNDNTAMNTVPLTPSDLSGSVLSATEINLSWTDRSTNEDGFKVQRKTGTSSFVDIANVKKDISVYSDKGLTTNTTYIYRVYAYNSAGNSPSYSNELTVKTFGLPELSTTNPSAIMETTAKSGGDIISSGGTPVTARGVVWNNSPNPTISLTTKTTDGTGVGRFLSNITGLNAGVTYYIRAYATNSSGTSYGNEIVFTSSSQFNINLSYGTINDVDGNSYKTIKIGNQTWMAENLRTTRYNNGIAIPNITNTTQWMNATSNAWCYYNNESTNNNIYGKLYNGYVINNNNNVCPAGWHVPSDAEWKILESFLGGYEIAGGKMKSVGVQYWTDPNFKATNSSGFSAMPGGQRYWTDGTFNGITNSGSWWSSTESGSIHSAITRNIAHNVEINTTMGQLKKLGVSIRCIKD